MRKQLAAAGLTAGLAVGGVSGFVFTSGSTAVGAQDETTTTTAPAAPKADRPDRSQHIKDALQPLIDDGTITQAQADKVTDALIAAQPEGRPGGWDHGGPRGGKGGGFGFGGLDEAATALGMTADELKSALKDGSSIADIAKDKGVDLAKVIDALVVAAKERVQQQVADEKLTQEQADERIAGLTERITALVNGERPEGARRGGPDGGSGGWGHGPKDGAPADTTTTTEG
jgi:hypothetical protein